MVIFILNVTDVTVVKSFIDLMQLDENILSILTGQQSAPDQLAGTQDSQLDLFPMFIRHCCWREIEWDTHSLGCARCARMDAFKNYNFGLLIFE